MLDEQLRQNKLATIRNFLLGPVIGPIDTISMMFVTAAEQRHYDKERVSVPEWQKLVNDLVWSRWTTVLIVVTALLAGLLLPILPIWLYLFGAPVYGLFSYLNGLIPRANDDQRLIKNISHTVLIVCSTLFMTMLVKGLL